MPTIATVDQQVTHAAGVNVANLGCLLQDRLNSLGEIAASASNIESEQSSA
jgi:hypothetical protein